MKPEHSADCEILVIGAGVSGIGAGALLRKAGFEDFLILDKAREVGGTWRDHTYPGLTVDIPSLTYSYSFEPKPDWSSLWAPQPEVLDYLRHCAGKYRLEPHLRLGEEVVETRYDQVTNLWRTRLRGGRTYTSRYVINASGYLSTARWPDIDGLDGFLGRTLHTCQWSPDIELAGARVALIGTGATAIQLGPEIADAATALHVYQRTPIWLLPKPPLRFPRTLQRLFRALPATQRAARLTLSTFMELVFFRVFTNYRQAAWLARAAQRAARNHIRRQVDDPVTAERLTPDYDWGCKRPSFSNTFYPMFNRPHVELVTAPIARITPTGVVTSDGVERGVDTLICATGYQAFEKGALPTYPVHGRDDLELREFWDTHRYQAFRGFAVHGFPNYFLIFGPYSVASATYHGMVEVAMANIIRCMKAARRHGTDYVEVTDQAQARDHQDVLRKKRKSLWSVADCAGSNTYYFDRFGDTPGFRPSYQPVEIWASRTLSARHFDFSPIGQPVAARPAPPAAAARPTTEVKEEHARH
jgi:cation diffusion facilitator CzcD-associated flavoprotein CzcO